MKYIYITALALLLSLGNLRANSSEDCFVNPPICSQLCPSNGFFLQGDFIYWIAQVRGLCYAQDGEGNGTIRQNTGSNPISGGSINFDGDVLRVHPNWDPGFRIGLGYTACYDAWTVWADWTRFHTHARESHDFPNGSSGIVLWGHVAQTVGQSTIFTTAKWGMDLDTVDLKLGRYYWIGCHCVIKPYIGVIGADIDQRLAIDYTLFPQINRTSAMDLRLKCDFTGGGLEVGMDPRFVLGKGISIQARAAGSILYGRFHGDFQETADGFLIAKSPDHFCNSVANLQLALGIGWDYTFTCGSHLGLHALWEENYWFGVNRMNHWLSELQKSYVIQQQYNMILQGLSAGARFDF